MKSTLLVVYGALLDTRRLARALGRDNLCGNGFALVRIPGFRRLWNVVAPARRAGPPIVGLNLEPVAGLDATGIAVAVSGQELARLDARDPRYLRRLVRVVDFASGAFVGSAYVYLALPSAPWVYKGGARVDPAPAAVARCRDAAYRLGLPFGAAFDETTFLADGRTLATELLGDPRERPLPA